MSLQGVLPFVMAWPALRLPVVIEVSGARLTSDAGLLPVRAFDERLRFTAAVHGGGVGGDSGRTGSGVHGAQRVVDGAAADVWHLGGLRGPERPHSAADGSGVQDDCGSESGWGGPGESADVVAAGECGDDWGSVAVARRDDRSVHRVVRGAAEVAHIRHGCL